MATTTIDIDLLSIPERLDLLDRLWESLRRSPELVPLTSAQREDLDQRLDELERQGPDRLTPDDVARFARGGD